VPGQVSLEFLLVTAAFLAVLGLWWGVGGSVWSEGTWALDTLEAQRFIDELSFHADALELLGDGSAFELIARPAHAWRVSGEGTAVVLVVSEGTRSKRFERASGLVVAPFAFELDRGAVIRVMRVGDALAVDADG
jgi:hypothetical protein